MPTRITDRKLEFAVKTLRDVLECVDAPKYVEREPVEEAIRALLQGRATLWNERKR